MAATPIIRSAQSGKPTLDGVDRKDLVTGSAVTVSDVEPANTGGTGYWNMLFKPPASSAALSSTTAAAPTFTPDTPGTYVIERLYYATNGARKRYFQYLAVVHPESGIRVPAAGEGLDENGDGRLFDDGGNDDYGWWGALDGMATALEELIAEGSGGRVSDDDTTPGNLEDKIVGSGDVTVSVLNDGGNEQLQIAVDLSGVEADIATLDGRLDTAESDINTLETSVAAASALSVTAVKTGNYTAAIGELVRCDPSAGEFTVTLPTASGNSGKPIIVKNVTNSLVAIIVDGNGAETIDGVANFIISGPRYALHVRSDGTNWVIV